MSQTIFYYEVWVASPKYHKDSLLTYSSDKKLEVGTPIVVVLQNSLVPALVIRSASKPRFKTKDISREISDTPLSTKAIELARWLKDYYPAPTGQIMTLFLSSGLVSKSKQSPDESAAQKVTQGVDLPPLTKEQQKVMKSLNINNSKPAILHGDTGTGKTRMYLEVAEKTLKEGKSAIILTPEIGLTPQLAQECKNLFPDQTIVIHSRLTPAEKRNSWLKILESSEPLVVVGARSALFSPIKEVGTIIVDEFHDSSYKQEQAPHYLATRVSAKLAKLHGARLILGSATPLVADYYTFEKQDLLILRMKEKAVQNKTKKSRDKKEKAANIIDLKTREQFTRSSRLSNELVAAIGEALQRKEQSLIFLNRRGTARLIICSSCGWQELCPNCDLPLTYHGDTHKVICHTCGFNKAARSNCPSCGSSDIIFRSVGTKALVVELEKLFQGAKIKRFDSDLGKKERLESNYQELKSGGYDIIVGTQMIGKGLDLPRLSVLGVVTADTSLSFPDYTSSERTYQLITQVLGRINRGHLAGRAYIQTYHPGNKTIRYALDGDYDSFYSSELKERKSYNFPPFTYTLKVSCAYAKREDAENAASKLAENLSKNLKHIEVIGPSPKFIEKTSGRYRWQIIIKSKDRNRLVNIIKQLPPKWSYDIDPVNLL